MSSDETHALHDYSAAKREVASLVRAAKQFLDGQSSPEADEYQSLLVKLAEDRFNLAVVGQFKRGKSSLMNAVIGRNLLPTGLLPLTSAVTALCYGPQERAVLKRKGWVMEPEIPLAQLAEYVTEQGNPGNAKGILEVRVELPVEFLRRGLYFVDTPGIGSLRQENTATTYSFLPGADAVIWVTSVEAPLSEAEQAFLYDVRQLVRKIFVVVNKVDLLAAHEHDQVLHYIRTGIQQIVGATEIRLYPLSAWQGLEGKLNGDDDRLRQSGLPAFESALASFLAEEKSQAFLVAILDRALGLLDKSGTLSAQAGDLHTRMEALRSALLAGTSLVRPTVEPEPTSADAEEVVREIAAEHQARRGRGRTGSPSGSCRICAAQSDAVFDFFAQWQYALARTAEARRAFTELRGFCHVHTWQFQQMASPTGIAEGYAAMIDRAATTLHELTNLPPAEGSARIRELLPEPASCPACRILRETAEAEIARFVTWIGTDKGQRDYRRSPDLCLPHLRAVLAAVPSTEIAQLLLHAQARHLEELAEDLQSFVLKRDALRRGLIRGDEENAWWRALVQLTGERTAEYQWSVPHGGEES